ncbi:hypothetical protein P692DRAFT_20832741 [Suillus brevipes Sb2]|nr:hypothetical protein P692DRAFT_20832741 [Suillus brevipes Sb2]
MPRQPMTRLCGCGVQTRQQKGQELERTADDRKPGIRIDCVANSPNREILASGDRKGKVLLWSIGDNTTTCV